MSLAGTWRQFLAAFAATLGIFGLGTVLAWTSPALPSMEAGHHFEKNELSDETKSWIGSIAVLGALLACPFAGFSADRFGRRKTMGVISLPFVAGWIMVGLASGCVPLILVGRFVSGFCAGVFSLSAPIYIAETAEDSIRGAMSNMFQIMMVLGILFTYVVGAYVSWNVLAFISAAVPACALACLLFVPESPRYLMIKSRPGEALRAMTWLRQTSDESVEEELGKLESSLQESAATSAEGKLQLKSFLSARVLKPIMIVLSLMVFEQMSGYNGVIFYIGSIFKASGSDMNSNLSSILVGIVQVLATIVSGIFVDRAGRRILLLLGQVFMALPLIVLGFYFHLKASAAANGDPKAIQTMDSLGWLPVVCLVIFISAFSLGIGPLSWTMLGELLAPNIKGVCSSVAVCLVWLCAFIVTKTFATIATSLGIDWCFWIYAITCVIGFISIYFTVPETKGKSLDEIQEIFAK